MPVLPLGADVFGSMRIATTVPVNASLTATMVRVTFRSNTGPYKAGETAAFLPDDASALAAANLATASA